MKNQGFILLTALLFLNLMMLLVLSQLQMLWLYRKSLNQLLHKHQVIHLMENHIKRVAAELTSHPRRACLFAMDQANAAIADVLQGKGCVYAAEGMQFHLVIEDLGTVACLQHVAENRLYSTYHWRITMASAEHDILQIRYASLVPEQVCSSTTRAYIKPGVMSWRFLTR